MRGVRHLPRQVMPAEAGEGGATETRPARRAGREMAARALPAMGEAGGDCRRSASGMQASATTRSGGLAMPPVERYRSTPYGRCES